MIRTLLRGSREGWGYMTNTTREKDGKYRTVCHMAVWMAIGPDQPISDTEDEARRCHRRMHRRLLRMIRAAKAKAAAESKTDAT